MRIRTAGVIAVTALALAAAGCGSGKTSTSSSPKPAGGTLVIWADDQRAAALKPFAEKFGKDNGVTVQVQAISKDLQTTFVTAAQSGNYYDSGSYNGYGASNMNAASAYSLRDSNGNLTVVDGQFVGSNYSSNNWTLKQ